MSKDEAIDDLISSAFRLAHFIQGDKETAIRVVAGGLAKLEVATTVQGKRLYYRPTGRSSLRQPGSGGFRNKVAFSDAHLLQRLLYVESEFYEKRQEEADASTLDEEDMIIRYIKHLVRITIRRNSFYVTLGKSRLLYNYSTAETIAIYNTVIQDPERVKDDYYYRSRKRVLMHELKERFGAFIEIRRGQRGEEKFRAHDHPNQHVELVEQCLTLFTPWNTPCVVPVGFDPIEHEIPRLTYKGHDEEDKIEVDRIHAVLHPDCYQLLINSLGFDAPHERLIVPHFFLSNDSNLQGGRRGRPQPPPKLEAQDVEAIKSDLDEQAARRKKAAAGLLRVVVDGIEHARFDPKQARRLQFCLEGGAELIEIRTGELGRELLLATHLLTRTADGEGFESSERSIVLEGGQRLSIAVSPSKNVGEAVVDLTYRETAPLRAASLYSRQLLGSVFASSWSTASHRNRLNGLTGSRILISALVCLLLAACLVGISRYVRTKGTADHPLAAGVKQAVTPAEKEGSVTQVGDTSSSVPPTIGNSKLGTEQARRQNKLTAEGERVSPSPPRTVRSRKGAKPPLQVEDGALDPASVGANVLAPERSSSEEEVTRNMRGRGPSVSLPRVRKIYVESLEDGVLSHTTREMLVKALQASNRFTLTQNADDADALLKVSTKPLRAGKDAGSHRASIEVRLVNANGETIWPPRRRGSGGKYLGSAANVTDKIVKDLLDEIERSERQRD